MYSTVFQCHRDYKLQITYTETALAKLEFADNTDTSPSHALKPPSWLDLLTTKMHAYFQGQQIDFTQIPLTFTAASLFQRQVWQTTKHIPHGTVVSYQDIANRIDKVRGARAVGNALAANPILIIIPCHRVLTSTGKIGGYRAGIAHKKQLLAIEQLAKV